MFLAQHLRIAVYILFHLYKHLSCCCVSSTDRDIKFVRPLYSVEVTETEIAKFETEISDEDVHGHWKLNGEALHQSPVRKISTSL